VGVFVGVDPDDELDGVCQHVHRVDSLAGDDVDGIGPGRSYGRTVTGHTRLASGGQAPDQASCSGLGRCRQQRADKSNA
jgi:hypothetical protein